MNTTPITGWTLGLLAAAALALPACENPNTTYRDDTLIEVLDRNADPTVQPDTTPMPTIAGEDDVYPVDGMVGQINGRPIFADSVFHGDDPIHDGLGALGRRYSRPAFREKAEQMIEARLRSMLLDALLLADAERDLSGAERSGLRAAMQSKREQLIRAYGRGSLAVAEEEILAQTGKTFAERMEDFRKGVIVRRYIAQVVTPKVNVNRRDIERYYDENIERFQPPTTRSLRLIRVKDEAEAQAVAKRLADGESFASLAGDEVNAFMRSSGGLMEDNEGERPLAAALDPINDLIPGLAEGDWAGPAQITGVSESIDGRWYVYLESLDAPKQQTLMDVQLQIEATLIARQRQTLTNELYADIRRGIDNAEVDRMTAALVEIAVSRYAAIDNAGGLAPGS